MSSEWTIFHGRQVLLLGCVHDFSNPDWKFMAYQMKHRNWLRLYRGIINSRDFTQPGEDGISVSTAVSLEFLQLSLFKIISLNIFWDKNKEAFMFIDLHAIQHKTYSKLIKLDNTQTQWWKD